MINPLEARWAKEPVLTIDGGLATEMEAKGVNIVSNLFYDFVVWSDLTQQGLFKLDESVRSLAHGGHYVTRLN